MWKQVSLVSCIAVCLSLASASGEIVAYWPLDEGAGITVGDRTGTWNGTISGDVTWVEGKVGTALSFPGGDNYVDFGNVQIGDSMTLVYWCYNPEKAFERPIGQHSGDYTSDPGWAVLSRNEGEGGVWFRVHGADNAWNGGDIVITDNLTKTEWYHLAFTFDGATRELSGYLNGELKVTNTCEEGRTIEGNQNDLRLGNVGTGETFSGMLDDIAIWGTALTAEEVLDIFLLGPEVIDPRQAGAPDPEDEAVDVPRDTTLTWTPGMYAGTHDVYFGGTFED
ncbi:MAG: LamG domain-containing protein, partial [Planctomycetota bacterium]